MNCVPGDLAVLVRSVCGNEGKIVRRLRLVGNVTYLPGGRVEIGPVWMTDTEIPKIDGRVQYTVEDAILRPIRDPGDDAVDEVLRKVPSPAWERAWSEA